MQPFVFQCFAHLLDGASHRGSSRAASRWVTVSRLPNGRTLAALNAVGSQVWRDLIAFCAAERLYPLLRQQAACVSTFVQWFARSVLPVAGNRTDDLFDAHSLTLAAAERAGQSVADIPPPRLLGNASLLPASFCDDKEADDATRFIDSPATTLSRVLCEKASASFFVYLPCAMGVHVHAESLFVSSTPYAHLPARHDENAMVPTTVDADEEDAQASRCEERFGMARFALGAERQLSFARMLCTRRARSHDYSLWALEHLEQLPIEYAAFHGVARRALRGRATLNLAAAARASTNTSEPSAAPAAVPSTAPDVAPKHAGDGAQALPHVIHALAVQAKVPDADQKLEADMHVSQSVTSTRAAEEKNALVPPPPIGMNRSAWASPLSAPW
jgi:hypothetical protein